MKEFQPGDKIYFLYGYDLEEGVVISVAKKSIRIEQQIFSGVTMRWEPVQIRRSHEQCAHPDEKIRVIWEMWKGVNGRGGYRIERDLYPEVRIPAKEHPRQGYVWEESYGKLNRV